MGAEVRADIPKNLSHDNKELQEACCQIGPVTAVRTTKLDIEEPTKPDAEPSSIVSPCSQRTGRRRSARARQREKKFWASVRCRTPSPDIWDASGECHRYSVLA